MKVFITGIAGFLGSHLARRFIMDGHEVHGNDSLICGDMDNVPGGAKFYDVDCCNQGEMFSILDHYQPDVIYHCAATAHEGFSVFSPSFITKNIYEASVATFSAAIAANVKRIVYLSSMSRYGVGVLPFREQHIPKPVDPYGVAKVAAEDTLKILCKTHGVEYVIAVPHNIIGVGQRYCDPYRNVVSIFANRAKQKKPLLIYGDGTQKRLFSPVEDCVDSLVKMATERVSGDIFNIGPDEECGKPMTILEIAKIVSDACGEPLRIRHMEERPTEVKDAWCSSNKARKVLGYHPVNDLHDCIKTMCDAVTPKEFEYNFPLEISSDLCPRVWRERLM